MSTYTITETTRRFSDETIDHYVCQTAKANAEIGIEIDTIWVKDTQGRYGVANGNAKLHKAIETVCGKVLDLLLIVEPKYIIRYI